MHYLPKNYSHILAPNNEFDGNPLEVGLEINDLDVIEVNDVRFTVKIKLHLGIHWDESRIIQLDTYPQGHKTPLDLKLLDILWTPDLDVYSLQGIKEFKVMGKSLAGKGRTYQMSIHY